MILEILSIFALFITTIGWGSWAKFFLSIRSDSIPITVIVGLSFFGAICCLLSFFTPLTVPIEILLLIISIVPYFFKKLRGNFIRLPKEIVKSVWFWVFVGMTLLAGCYFPFVPDHFGYYIPTLNWLNKYGLLPGTATVDWNL
jgi:hypothetical protein